MQHLGTPVLLIVAVLLVVGFLYTPQGCGNGGSMSAAANAELSDPVLSVGESKVYAAEAAKVIDNMRASAMQEAAQRPTNSELTPFEMLSIYMQAASSLARQGAVLELGRQQGIEIDEDQMHAVLVQMNEDTLAQQKRQFEMMQALQIGPMEANLEKLKKDKASADKIAEAEKALNDAKALTFDKIFQEQTGQDPQTYVNAQVAEIEKNAAVDPVIARGITASAIQMELNNRYAQGIDTSDAALKASYDKLVYKQIMLSGDDAKKKADEVLAKIKGGMDFDEAAKQFSMLKKPDGTTQLDSTTETRLDLMGDELHGALNEMKQGDVSEVVEFAGAAYIYKLVAVRPDAPADFASVKTQRSEMLRQRLVNAKINEEIVNLIGATGEKVQWVDGGLKLLADYMNTNSATEQVPALEKILEQSEDVTTNFPDLGPLIRYAVIGQLQVEVKDAEKKKELNEKMLDAYEAVVTIAPSTDLRFQYINALMEAGNGDRALELLLDNAIGATPVSDATLPIISRVEALLPKVANRATKDNKLIAEIQEEVKRWREDLAARKKEEEDEKKRAAAEEAELKRQEAEEKKNETSNKPANPPSTVPNPSPVKPEPKEPALPGSGG